MPRVSGSDYSEPTKEMKMEKALTLDFSKIRMNDVALVGGKNASLGELF